MKWLEKFDWPPRRSKVLFWLACLMVVVFIPTYIFKFTYAYVAFVMFPVTTLYVLELLADIFDQNHFMRKIINEVS